MARLDSNSDGAVSFDEMCAHEKEKRGEVLDEARARKKCDEIDTNNDGTITKTELDNAPKRKGVNT